MLDVVIRALLFFGVAVCVLSSVGILVMRGMYDKLHYVAPISTVGTLAIVAAVVLDQGLSLSALKQVVLLVLLCSSSAVLTQATARAMKSRSERTRSEGGRR